MINQDVNAIQKVRNKGKLFGGSKVAKGLKIIP